MAFHADGPGFRLRPVGFSGLVGALADSLRMDHRAYNPAAPDYLSTLFAEDSAGGL